MDLPGTLQFDGVSYPDGHASDPRLIGWMRGHPPPADLRVSFSGLPPLGFPQLRWSVCHMRELGPSASVWRGSGPPRPLPAPREGEEEAIDALTFTDTTGRVRRWDESLFDTYTDGIVVLHRGRRVYERYFGELQAHMPHACFSITKSYVATLATALLHERILDEKRNVAHYLPQMAGTGYEDATLRELLDMEAAPGFNEHYAGADGVNEAGSDMATYASIAYGIGKGEGRASIYDFLRGLRKNGSHGQGFAYKSPNTDLLGWVLTQVTGEPLQQMLSDWFWGPLGCEQDAYLALDGTGVPTAGGGLSAALRDLARFGELMRRDGDWYGRQVLAPAVVADIRRGGDPERLARANYPSLGGYSYRGMWWVSHNALGAFEARGIYGQRLYVAPAADMVIARFASHPVASNAANDPITLPAFLALGRRLGRL